MFMHRRKSRLPIPMGILALLLAGVGGFAALKAFGKRGTGRIGEKIDKSLESLRELKEELQERGGPA